jgi:hypothetical protein
MMVTEIPGETDVTVLLQNDRVRVAEMRVQPGDRGKMVERPDRVQYVIKGGMIREHFPDGQSEEYELKTGTANGCKRAFRPWRTSENRN